MRPRSSTHGETAPGGARDRGPLVARPGQWWYGLVTVLVLVGALAAHAAMPASAAVTVKADLPSGQLAGSSITWTAVPAGMKHPVFRFSVGAKGGSLRVIRDFSQSPTFTWTPLQPGEYAIQVQARDGFSATSAKLANAAYTIHSRVKGKSAVISATANPLVALYSAPPCGSGQMRVQFRPAAGSSAWQLAAAQPCRASESVNVLVAGLKPGTRYAVRQVVSAGKIHTASPVLTFTTGTPPHGLEIATFSVKRAATAQADHSTPVIFHALNPQPSPTLANPIATDLSGQLVWYYDSLHSGLQAIWPVHIQGGTVLLFGRSPYHKTGDDVFREVDLAGDIVRETNVDIVNAQLAHLGHQPVYMFHHDALRLPDGSTALLGASQKTLNGHDVMGDQIIVLDSNLQVRWAWNPFDHLTPPANFPPHTATCINTGPTLCALPDPKALDWTHANGLGWSSADNDLTLSFRNLSWMVKIDYRNGRGNGSVVWRLGSGGDFSILSSDPHPWFSHPHNVYFINADTVIAFDNSNDRCQDLKLGGCQSRGQAYRLDEKHHTATLVLNASLGSFWQALGSAQVLPNGDFTFAGGFAPPSREVEVRPNGSKVFELDSPLAEYRAYRLKDLR